MPDTDLPPETKFKEASSDLDQGLKSCRAVISGYRALLAGDHPSNPPSDEAGDDVDEAGQGVSA